MSSSEESPASQAAGCIGGAFTSALIIIVAVAVFAAAMSGLNVVVPLDKLEAQMCATMAADGTPCE